MPIKEVLSSPFINKSSEQYLPPVHRGPKVVDVLEPIKGQAKTSSCLEFMRKIWQAIVNFFCRRKAEVMEPEVPSTQKERNPLTLALQKLHNPKCSGSIHGIYMTTNEAGLEKARAILANTMPMKQGCHVGCAGWHNFDIVVSRKSTYCLIFDFNPENKKFIDATLEILKSSNTRESFVEKMTSILQKGSVQFCQKSGLNSVEEMVGELKRKGSWLSSEESYQFIRNLTLTDRIAVITEDIRNTGKFAEINSLLRQFNIPVDSVYLSNICIFMKTVQDQESFASSIQALAGPKTIVINCPRKTAPSFTGEDISNPLMQYICLGEDLQGAGKEKLFCANF